MQQQLNAKRLAPPTHPLAGKTTYLPRMAEGSARALAAVLRSLGIDAEVVPPSDARTLEIGGKYSSGDECFPLKVTLGDYLRIIEEPGFDPKKTAFFMMMSQGPCRFGQYAPYLQSMLRQRGYGEVTIFSPDAVHGYGDFGEASNLFVRGAWRAILAGDILLKLMLKTRPHEQQVGSADRLYEESVQDVCRVLEVSYPSNESQMLALKECLLGARDRFRRLPIAFDDRKPWIGIVGEIFCRLHDFSNCQLLRRMEDAGAEVWMNDVAEWVWYTNVDQERILKLRGRRFSLEALSARIREHIQLKDEHELLELFREDFTGYEEPGEIQKVLDYAEPYLPNDGADGEMVLNVGKAVYFAEKGLDGVIDISPFSCMNGIVGEAIYPRISRDYDGIPIRNFYFDGTQSDLERDIGIFLELAKSYQARKTTPRPIPHFARRATA